MISPEFPKKPPEKTPGGGDEASDEDALLWEYVTRDIQKIRHNQATRPLSKGGSRPSRRRPTDVGDAAYLDEFEGALEGRRAAAPAPEILQPGGQEVDRRTAQRLKRGRYDIDATVDLHGLTQAAAHKKLCAVLLKSYARQQRCVLVITGKGNREAGTGVIKRAVPQWLQEPPLQAIVLRAEAAKPEHGGAGALYVLLRRKRTAGMGEG